MSTLKTNRLLASLSDKARDLLLAKATPISLPVKTSLFQSEKTPPFVYFLTSGMASIISAMEDGGSAEVGIVGYEGLIGGLHMMGPAKVQTDSFVQLAGTGLRVPFNDAKQLFRESEEVRD